jgi:hypothetical protein
MSVRSQLPCVSVGGVSTIPAAFSSLVDDAAIFPPGNAPLTEALSAHRGHRAAAYADLVGPFVVRDVALPDLIDAIRAEGSPAPLTVTVVVTGGAGAIEPAVRWATRAEELELAAVELGLRDEEDLPRNARRVTTVVDQLRAAGDLDDDTPVYVEPPRVLGTQPPTSWLSALDEVAALDLRLKLRTGGVTADAFPGTDELAVCIDAALDRELRFKCTAGLHNALRHRDDETGFDHHGFLNVMAATRAALDGAAVPDVAEVLARTEPAAVREALDSAGPEGLVSARRWFTSFGSCSVLEPLEDLIDLDLLPDLPLESA